MSRKKEGDYYKNIVEIQARDHVGLDWGMAVELMRSDNIWIYFEV